MCPRRPEQVTRQVLAAFPITRVVIKWTPNPAARVHRIPDAYLPAALEPHCARLREISLIDNEPVTDAELREIGRLCPRLEALDLTHTKVRGRPAHIFITYLSPR